MKEYCIGADVGGTTVKLGLFHSDGRLEHKWEIPTRKEEHGKYILPDIADSVRGVLDRLGIGNEEVYGVGIGVPGPTTDDGFVEVCVNLGWTNCHPGEELSAMLGLPVKVGNDANVAALGEMWKGGGEGYQNIVLLTLGTGVGGGIIQNGRILAGHRGLGGELGHITVNPAETEPCNCGNYGCLEQYASASGITRITKKMIEQGERPTSLRKRFEEGKLNAKAIFDAAKEGDETAREAVSTLARYLGQVLASVALTVDPDVFVIGGGVSKAGQFLCEQIEANYRHYVSLTEKKVPVVLAKLGNDAGIYGAARMILE